MKVKKAAVATESAAANTKGRKASAAAEPAEAPVKTGKNLGRTTGMRIGAYQNHTMDLQSKRRLTDEELGKDWAEEFPDARCQFAERMDIVRVVRRLYNLGKHYNNPKPAEPVAKYELQNGRRVAVEEAPTGRGRKAAAPSKAA